MHLLDQLLGHDSWTTAEFLRFCTTLTDEQLDREFDIGHRSIRKTLDHIVGNLEVWSALVADADVVRDQQPTAESSVTELLNRLEAAAGRLANAAQAIHHEKRWTETFTDPFDGIRKQRGLTIVHVITHSMHHRAQLLYMMRSVGLRDLPEGDIFSWCDATSAQT